VRWVVRRTEVNDGRRVDATERSIRFGCGLLTGFALGVFVVGRIFTTLALSIDLGLAVLFGILAAAFGDRFWYGLMRLFSWFRW
jgi:hypothetical protein